LAAREKSVEEKGQYNAREERKERKKEKKERKT
jgi:hypothetical protein